MDQKALIVAAGKFRDLLERDSLVDIEVRQLRDALSDLLSEVLSGKLVVPLDWRDVPGAWFFTEGSLARYEDLEEAYARFKIEVTGGESPALRVLRQKMAPDRSA